MPEGQPHSPDSMWAAYIERTGSAEEIRYGRLPVPSVGPRQTLVQVEAQAANPIDTYIRSGAIPLDLPFPFIIGRDLVGHVVRVGARVRRFHMGQRVWCASQGYDGRQGSFAELARVEEAHRLVEGRAPAARRMAGSCSKQMRCRPAASARPRARGLPASRR